MRRLLIPQTAAPPSPPRSAHATAQNSPSAVSKAAAAPRNSPSPPKAPSPTPDDPPAATPSAPPPALRQSAAPVFRIPAAIPACSGSTDASAADVIAGTISPIPNPTGSSIKSITANRSCSNATPSSASADATCPVNIGPRGPSRAVHLPEIGFPQIVEAVSGRKQSPVCSGEKSSPRSRYSPRKNTSP